MEKLKKTVNINEKLIEIEINLKYNSTVDLNSYNSSLLHDALRTIMKTMPAKLLVKAKTEKF